MKTPTERDIKCLLLELHFCEPEARADFEEFKKEIVEPHVRNMRKIIGSQLRMTQHGEKREIMFDFLGPEKHLLASLSNGLNCR